MVHPIPFHLMQDPEAVVECAARYIAPGSKILVVHDPKTIKAQGKQFCSALESTFQPAYEDIGLNGKPTLALAKQLAEAAGTHDALIALGSGTINDLCKFAAHQASRRYISIATAPSMNGYVSSSASLIVRGLKQSFVAIAPSAVIADCGVLAHAPRRLVRSGLGDLMCRTTAQTDWLMSHLLLGTQYRPEPFERLKPFEAELAEHAGKLADGDPAVITLLMQALIESGEGMRLCGGSYPASQGEHMIAHTMEMLYHSELRPSFHGEQIAVTTLAMSRLQHKVMLDMPVIQPTKPPLERIQRVFGKAAAEELERQGNDKAIDAAQANALNERMQEQWPAIKEQIMEVMMPTTRLELTLQMTRCCTAPEDLGWSKDRYENALTHAYLTRNRFTFLDLAAMAGKRYWFD